MQLVEDTTHDKGHLLDLVLVRCEDANYVTNIKTDMTGLSDHYAVQFRINIPHPPVILRKIEYRNLKAIDNVKLKDVNFGICIVPC